MECVDCGSAATSERRDRTAQGYRRFRCRDCGREFNERSAGTLNQTQYPSDVIALVVLWRLRYRLTLQDLSEMFLQRGIVFSHETVREWEAKLTPVLSAELRRRRRGKGERDGARGTSTRWGIPAWVGPALIWAYGGDQAGGRAAKRRLCPSSGGRRHALLWTG